MVPPMGNESTSIRKNQSVDKIMSEITPKFKLWLEYKGKPVLGNGGASILEKIRELGSLLEAAHSLSVSYRYAWGYLKKMEERLGLPVIETYKGGAKGGGSTYLTELGEFLLRKHRRLKEFIEYALKSPELWEAYGLRVGEKNRIRGRIVKVERDDKVAKIKIAVEPPIEVVSVITWEAVEELDLKEGDAVTVVIKATEVMIDRAGGDGRAERP